MWLSSLHQGRGSDTCRFQILPVKSSHALASIICSLLPEAWDDDEALGRGFSVSALLTLRARWCLVWGLSCVLSDVQHVLGLYVLAASSISPGVTTKTVSRHCQMSPGGQNHPSQEPPSQRWQKHKIESTWIPKWPHRRTHDSDLNCYIKPLELGQGMVQEFVFVTIC